MVTLSVQVIQREASVATESSISEKRSISVVKRGARNINSFQEIPATSFNCAAQVDKYRQNTEKHTKTEHRQTHNDTFEHENA